MDLPSSHVFKALRDKGVTKLHHANSVITACQFIRSKSLLSRGSVDRLGITQTPQDSDEIDRRYSIWFDVFLDSVDIHLRARRANAYGPVTFVFDLKLIDRNGTGRLWITKLNPTKWANLSDKERWFQNRKEIESDFVVGRFDQMLVARHCGGELPFGRYLEKIILDDPELETDEDVDIFSMSVGALRLAMDESGIDVPIERRKCPKNCTCKNYWGEKNERLFQMFDPKI